MVQGRGHLHMQWTARPRLISKFSGLICGQNLRDIRILNSLSSQVKHTIKFKKKWHKVPLTMNKLKDTTEQIQGYWQSPFSNVTG